MTWNITPTVVLLAFASVAAFPVAFYRWRLRRTHPASVLGALILVCAGLILVGNTLEIVRDDLAWKVYWTKFQIFGFAIAPALYWLYALESVGQHEWRRPRTLVSLSLIPMVTILLTFTNQWHGLYVSDWRLDWHTDHPTLVRENGPWLWAYGVYALSLSAIATLRITLPLLRSGRLYRWQTGVLTVAASLALAAGALDWLSITPFPAVKVFPLMLAGAVVLITFTFLRLQRADFLPLARVAIAETMADPVIVLAADDRVLDMNPAALALIAHDRSAVVDHSLDVVWPELAHVLAQKRREPAQYGEEILMRGPARRRFDLQISTRTDWRGQVAYRVLVLRDITRLKQMEEELREREALYRSLVETSPDAIALTDLAGALLTANHQTAQLLGFETVEALFASGKNAFEMIVPEDQARAMADLQWNFADGTARNLEYRILRQDGSVVPVEVSVSLVTDGIGEPMALLSVIRDITERKQAEQRVLASLYEKEVLLKEIHHRVKNNMQVISSLLRLQAHTTQDEHVTTLFEDSQNRIRSMGLVHEQLYQSQNLATINLAEYIRTLADELLLSHQRTTTNIQLTIEAEDIQVDLDTAMPCGLILNELVSNALKHAFLNRQQGEVRVRLQTDGAGQLVVSVQDNGVGLPEDLDIQHTTSLGLQLVTSLTRQLKGTLDLHQDAGTTFVLKFANPEFATFSTDVRGAGSA